MNSHRIPKPDVSILAAICILLFCLEAAVLNYEHVYKATPDYSVRVLTRAIQSGDEETVTALVDDKAIAAGLFDGMASRGGRKCPSPPAGPGISLSRLGLALYFFPLRP